MVEGLGLRVSRAAPKRCRCGPYGRIGILGILQQIMFRDSHIPPTKHSMAFVKICIGPL